MYGMPCGYKHRIFSQGCYWKARLSMSRCVWLLILVESSFSHMHIQGIATFTFCLTILVCACVVHKRCHNLIVSECPRMKKDLNEVREWVSVWVCVLVYVCVCKCMCDDKMMSCGSIWHAFYSVYRAKGRASASTYPTSLENTTTKFPLTVTTADLSCTAWWNRVSNAKVSTYLLDLLEYMWTRLLCSQKIVVVICVVWICSGCKMNIHKRCEQNVAPNCGVNSSELASKLSEIGLLNTLSKRKSQVSS